MSSRRDVIGKYNRAPIQYTPSDSYTSSKDIMYAGTVHTDTTATETLAGNSASDSKLNHPSTQTDPLDGQTC